MLKRVLLGCVLVLAACAPAGGGEPTPSADTARSRPTVPAPAYVESAAVLTLDNIAEANYLGRLDVPDAASTIFAYSFSPDGTRLAALNNDYLLIWDLLSGELVARTSRVDSNAVYFSPDKTEVYTVNVAGRVAVYEADTAQSRTHMDAHDSFNNTKVFHADDGLLALGGLDGSVRVWDLLERRSLVTIEAHDAQIVSLAFSSDGEYLITASSDRNVHVWNWRERERLLTVRIEEEALRPVRVAFAPTGSQFAVGTEGDVRLYSFPAGERQDTLDIVDAGVSAMMTYSPDGRFLLTGLQNREPTLWNAETGELIAELPGVRGPRFSASFAPEGDMLLTSALNGPVNLWDLTRINEAATNRAELPVGSNTIIFADWAPDSRLMTFFDTSGSVYVWGIAPGDQQTAANR